jgi:hypothetical protein
VEPVDLRVRTLRGDGVRQGPPELARPPLGGRYPGAVRPRGHAEHAHGRRAEHLEDVPKVLRDGVFGVVPGGRDPAPVLPRERLALDRVGHAVDQELHLARDQVDIDRRAEHDPVRGPDTAIDLRKVVLERAVAARSTGGAGIPEPEVVVDEVQGLDSGPTLPRPVEDGADEAHGRAALAARAAVDPEYQHSLSLGERPMLPRGIYA